jgi:hypothetical protein
MSSISLNIRREKSEEKENKSIINELNNNEMSSEFTLIKIKVKDIEYKNECIVCMDQINTNETILRLTCGHYYHQNCIHEWLTKKSSCPQCRHSLIDNPFLIESDSEESDLWFSEEESDDERIQRALEFDRIIRATIWSDLEDNESDNESDEESEADELKIEGKTYGSLLNIETIGHSNDDNSIDDFN